MILVVGDLMIDIVVDPGAPLTIGTDTPARIAVHPGGSAANIACWIGHLGGAVAFAGRVGGEDAPGQAALLRACGVRPQLAIDTALPTGRTVAVLAPGGERGFYTDRGANLALCADDLPLALLDGARMLHVSGHTLAAPGPCAAAGALMHAARLRGCAVSVDAGSRAWLRSIGAAAFCARARDADTCFANAGEWALLAPHWAAETAVVTEGARGAFARRGGRVVRVAADPVAIADGIGAGDAFVAGFLGGRARGGDLPDCLAAAAAAARGALSVQGGRPPCSAPDRPAERTGSATRT